MAKIEEKSEILLEKPINDLGYDLYDIEYVKEGKDFFLRVYIDNENGINLNDCEKVSNVITEILDKEDYIKDQYFLEVSSPGIERILRKDKHLQDNIGNEIQIRLFKSQENLKEYRGILKTFDATSITIDKDNRNVKIDRKNISQIKTIYNWE